MNGWTCSYRKIWEHPLFRGNALRVGVFHWMIHTAAHKGMRFDAGGVVIEVARGQLCVSQAQICAATGISRQQLRTFLSALQTQHAIDIKPANGATKGRSIITICNYDKYQNAEGGRNQAENQSSTKHQPIKEQGNNPSNEGRGENAAADLRKQVWDQGVRVLASAGLKERAARSLLGRWVKQHGEGDVLAAVLAGQDRADPVAFIEARLNRVRRGRSDEDDRQAAWGIRDHEIGSGNFSRGGDHDPPSARNRTDNVSELFAHPAEEARPVPERDVSTGRGGLALLALRT